MSFSSRADREWWVWRTWESMNLKIQESLRIQIENEKNFLGFSPIEAFHEWKMKLPTIATRISPSRRILRTRKGENSRLFRAIYDSIKSASLCSRKHDETSQPSRVCLFIESRRFNFLKELKSKLSAPATTSVVSKERASRRAWVETEMELGEVCAENLTSMSFYDTIWKFCQRRRFCIGGDGFYGRRVNRNINFRSLLCWLLFDQLQRLYGWRRKTLYEHSPSARTNQTEDEPAFRELFLSEAIKSDRPSESF